jgi:hypothetical protein
MHPAPQQPEGHHNRRTPPPKSPSEGAEEEADPIVQQLGDDCARLYAKLEVWHTCRYKLCHTMITRRMHGQARLTDHLPE